MNDLPPGEMRLLVAHAAGLSRAQALTASIDRLDAASRSRAEAMIAARRRGEPIAYLLGHREFYAREFIVDTRVLIPRHETELLVDDALRWLGGRGDMKTSILDLGTGSGVLAVTIALECPTTRVVATDLSEDALAVARENARRLGASVQWHLGSWYDAIGDAARFDLIVSNPPYIARDDGHLSSGDLRFEPRLALTDGEDGTRALAAIVANARSYLREGGRLAVEHGAAQGMAARRMFDAAGFVDIDTAKDLAGLERVTAGTLPSAL